MTRRPPARRTRRRPTGASGRFFAALAALAAVMIGVPALLVVCSQAGLDSLHPLPGIGTGDEIRAFFERDLTATEIAPIAMRGLLIVGWLLWLGMAVSVVASILDATGSGLRSAVPQFAMFAGLGRWIAAGLTAFSSLAPNFVSAGSLASPRPFTVSSAAIASSSVTRADVPVPPGHARVQRGESIETFARRTLGDPARWPEIWELNKDKTVGPDGDAWTMAWKLSAGWDLRLPDGGKLGPGSDLAPPTGSPSDVGPITSAPSSADVGAPSTAPHRVVAGDSYWSIARSRLGDAATGPQVWDYTQALMAANASRLGYDDPAMLQAGDDVELVTVEVADFAPGAADASSVPQVLVESGDSYWAIAEEELGDDASPNDVLDLTNDLIDLNHPLLGYDVPPLIHPGDVVFLEDPSSFPPPAPVADVPDPDAAELDPALSEFIEVVQSVEADNEQLPPPVTAAPTTIVTPTTAAPTTTTSTSTVPPATPDDPAAEANPGARARPPVGVGEAALLSTGIVALLAAKRRARLRAAEPPARLPLPRPETAATERMLRRLDDGERLLRVDIALRAAAAVVAGTDHRVVVVRSAPDGTVEVSLSGPVTLGEPWTGSDRVWTLPRTVPVEELATPARSVGAPCIALVQIGIDEPGWDVLVDLEAIGALAVDADEATADCVVRAVAIGLACSEFAEVAHLVGVGIDPSVFLGHRHAQVVGTLDDGIELAATLVGAPASSQRSTFSLRARQAGGEMWEPAVVLVASAAAVAMAPSVAASLSGRGGVSVVAAGDVPGATWRLRPTGASWLLEPLGIRLTPVGVAAAELAAIADAVAGDALVAARVECPPVVPARDLGHGVDPGHVESHVAVMDAPTNGFDAVTIPAILLPPDPSTEHVGAGPATNGHGPLGGWMPPSPPSGSGAPAGDSVAFVDPDWTMMVRLMGHVDVVDRDGSPAKFDRSKTLELLAWLVTHGDRATRVGARTALWDQDVRDATFANVVSEARRAMARHVEPPEGDEWLRRTLTDELSLHELVISDADIAEARFAAGRTQTGEQALATLRPALDLLRDMPFSGTSYLWPEIEGMASSLVLLSTNLTAEYARRALALGDFEGVFWATGTGLKVLPGQEALIALRMRAHAEAGDLSGVRLEWEVYERVINADPWSDGEPAPKLVSLRKELLSK